jgi:glycolate oxidase FAD binding subunit
MRVVTAGGRITRAGGKVVKNVAGYDLCKLYIGSSGTLGVIVEVSMKIAPLPQASEEVRLEFESLEDACTFSADLKKRGVCLWEATVRRPMLGAGQEVSPAKVHILTVRLAGTLAGVQRSLAEIERLTKVGSARPVSPNHESEDEIDDRMSPGPTQGDLLQCQMSVLPSRVPELVKALDESAPGASISVRPICGTVTAIWRTPHDETAVHNLRTASARLGASLTVTDCSPQLKHRIDVFGDPPPAFELMRRVKQQFDPKGILSPGRFLGRL